MTVDFRLYNLQGHGSTLPTFVPAGLGAPSVLASSANTVNAPKSKPTAPRRDADQTRARIFAAAMDHFARRSYHHVTMRDIAADAGIDVALINRYFGTKEALFGAVVDAALDLSGLFDGDEKDLPGRIARYIVGVPTRLEGHQDPRRLLVVLNSGHDSKAVRLLRERISERIIKPLEALQPGRAASLNAALVTAFLIGFGYLSLLLQVPALTDVKTRELLLAVETMIGGGSAER